jgi:hypothetical protein
MLMTWQVRTNGPLALYKGYTLSVVGIIVYRGPYFGLFDTMHRFNPYRYQPGGSAYDYMLAVFTAFLIAQAWPPTSHHITSHDIT